MLHQPVNLNHKTTTVNLTTHFWVITMEGIYQVYMFIHTTHFKQSHTLKLIVNFLAKKVFVSNQVT